MVFQIVFRKLTYEMYKKIDFQNYFFYSDFQNLNHGKMKKKIEWFFLHSFKFRKFQILNFKNQFLFPLFLNLNSK